jgi:hypothetical protein
VNTIQSFCARYRTRETHENIKRPGSPRLTTQAQDLELRAFALANTHLDHRQVKEQTGSTLSLRSIRRRLRKSYSMRRVNGHTCNFYSLKPNFCKLRYPPYVMQKLNWSVIPLIDISSRL